MKIDFRIDWGYNMLYSRRHYHPVYHWDGELECDNFSTLKASLIEYPPAWWGPCHTARETPLDTPQWRSATRRKVSGLRVRAECGANARFKLVTLSGTLEFGAREIMDKGRLYFPVGPKFAFCGVTVTRSGFLWFRPPPRAGQKVFEARDLPLEIVDSQRMELAVLRPGESVEIQTGLARPDAENSLAECLAHLQAMILEPGRPEGKNQAAAEIPMELLADGKPAAEFKHYFRYHDATVQMLEDVWARFPMSPRIEKLSLKNCHEHYPLLISRLSFEPKATRHLQLTLPKWMLAGETATAKIFSLREEIARIEWDGTALEKKLAPGWNEFDFKVEAPGLDVRVRAMGGGVEETARVEVVHALSDETPEVMVGYDMTTVTHDDNGLMDWLLDHTSRTRLGNTVVFRNFRPSWKSPDKPSDESLSRWGGLCARRHIHAQSVNCHESSALQEAAGKFMHNAGRHEYPGVVYALDPEKGAESADMKEAHERYIAFLKADIDQVKAKGLRPAYGDASGGHRHCYLAGASFIRSETMVPHTQHLCSLARPAAEALGRGDWGVHIAIQHPQQPYHQEHHLGQYFLSMFQPWMMGASMIYEEDSLFLMFKEERQCWDDALTKGKRGMTREFFRFAKTHPRKGRNARRAAFFEGRYAAPFNGFICDSEQDPHYSVWGKFGNSAPEWGHGQPEKCRHLLDVLMPGASAHPLRQRFDRRRFFFSGTPYGDFDQVPAEASRDYLGRYSLLLNLGWNTMIEEDHEKLLDFVRRGGTLLTGIPQFSTHVRRDFLRDMGDLALWNNGDLSELCGVRIRGKGAEFKGCWNAADRGSLVIPELSRAPSDSPSEDGPCHLADIELTGAEPVMWDADSGRPLIVKRRLGKGEVHLVCAWAYPGHETLSEPVSAWIARLAGEHAGDCRVADPSGEVFWTVWDEGDNCRKLMLLNTDWASPGSRRPVVIDAPGLSFSTEIVERQPKIITILPDIALEPPPETHIEIFRDKDGRKVVRAHGSSDGHVAAHTRDGRRDMRVRFDKVPFADLEF